MKTSKTCNIIMVVINLLNFLIDMGIGFDNVMVETGLVAFLPDTLINLTLWGASIFLPICNLVMLIINVKDKKLRFFYMLLLIMSIDRLLIVLNVLKNVKFILGISIAIIILIHDLLNNEGKIKSIYSIINIILAILFAVLTTHYILYIELFFYVVLIVLLIKTKFEDKTKFQKALGVIIISVATILTIVLFANYKIIEISMRNKGEKFIDYVKNASISNENYIPICKNGKWGYVDSKGNVKIDYQYDKALAMNKICLKNNNSHIVNLAIVTKQDKCLFINQNNEKILEFYMNKYMKEVLSQGLGIESFILEVFKQSTDISTELSQPEIEYENNIYEPYHKVFAKSNGVYQVKILDKQHNISKKEIEQINKPILNLPNNTNIYRQYNDIKYKISDSIEEKEIEINLQESDDGQIYLGLYSDGYIPYYNVEEKRQGYYDKDLNLKLINGNYEILDIKEGYILLRYFDDNYKHQGIIVIDSNLQKVKQFKQIQTLEDGYIVKKDNDKIVFLDKDFNELSDEYDSIYSKDDFYIMGKTQNSKVIYYIIDKNNYQILNQNIESFLCYISHENKDGTLILGSLNCQGTYLLDDIYNMEY